MTFNESEKLNAWILGRIREITRMHPLTETEADFLALYARESILETAKMRRDYRTVIDWLHSTSRISPRERDQLKKLTEEIMKWRPEGME